jgi:hypothetical protein
MATCRSCDAEIVWARNEQTGKLMPFDATPDPKGRWALDDADEGEGLEAAETGRPAELVAYIDPMAGTRYTSHFATCPQASEWRKPRRDHRG